MQMISIDMYNGTSQIILLFSN